MKILCLFGQYAYGRIERGLAVEYCAFIPALRRLGHEVFHFDTWTKTKYTTYVELNNALLDYAANLKPDLILTVVTDVEIWNETILAIRSILTQTPVITWTTDDTWKYNKTSRFIGLYYNGITTTYSDIIERYHADGIPNVHLSQWGANEDWLAQPLSAAECKYDVSFIGIAYGDRRNIVSELRSLGIPIDTFGHGWPNGPVDANDIPKIMQNSRISLNFSKGLYGGPNQIKARTFEVPGAGGFLLTETAPGLSKWYEIGSEIDTWNDIDELARKIQYYLDNPAIRNEMAIRSHNKTISTHRYEHRMLELISWATSLTPNQYPIRAGGPRCLPIPGPPNKFFVFCRWLTVSCCRILWGKSKAIPYARRIFMELSYRICGKSTYSAFGIVGRLFPPLP